VAEMRVMFWVYVGVITGGLVYLIAVSLRNG
jgi:hypothetical protein